VGATGLLLVAVWGRSWLAWPAAPQPLRGRGVQEVISAAIAGLLPVQIASKANPDRCVGVVRGEHEVGKELLLWDCETSPDAFIVPMGFEEGQIRWVQRPSLCLKATHAGSVQLSDCAQQALTKLDFKVSVGGDSGTFQWAKDPDKCIALAEADTNATRLRLVDCSNETSEDVEFFLRPVRVSCDRMRWNWSNWSSCSKPCGTGFQVRARKVVQEDGGGMCYDRHGDDTRNCNTEPCVEESVLTAQRLVARHYGVERSSFAAPTTTTTTTMFRSALNRSSELRDLFISRREELMVVRIKIFADTSRCLGVEERTGGALGMRPQIRPCKISPDAFLIRKDFSDGPIRWAAFPEYCLDAPSGNELQLWNCSTAPSRNTDFHIEEVGVGGFVIRKVAEPDKCIDIPNIDSSTWICAMMWQCSGTKDKNQHFYISTCGGSCRWDQWKE